MLNSKNIKGEAGVAEHELDVDSDMEEENDWQMRNEADMQLPGAKKLNNA